MSQWQTSTYLETVGTITHSKVKVESDTDGTSYSPEIHYNYHVDGEQYSGEVYKFIQNFDSRKYVRNIIKEHPVAKEVPVYYHPDQPQKAVLFKGFEMRDAMPLIFLLPFNGIALVVFCVPLTLRLERLFRNDNHWFRDFPIRNDGLTSFCKFYLLVLFLRRRIAIILVVNSSHRTQVDTRCVPKRQT
ncbi:MAG: DUF3592 domain-containing protein, partial [Planctomycetaceae bacterium]|nr:DUF3592 domain-containing protein [Planctomycetaceae bacterium]